MLDMAQVVAWARMFGGYARTESFSAAARDTFDPGRPCAICRALRRARETCGGRAPAVLAPSLEKMVIILERVAPFVPVRAAPEWPEVPSERALARSAKVPVPPPRANLA